MGFVIGIIIWGTWIMRDSLNAKTEKHISDVTEKLADYMEFRIETKLNYMEQLADSLAWIPQIENVEGFLKKKAEAFGLASLIIQNKSGDRIGDDASYDDLNEWVEFEKIDYDDAEVISTAGEVFVYTVPIRRNGAADSVLIGVSEHGKIYEQLRNVDLGEMSEVCIIDAKGRAVILPENNQYFQQIDAYYNASVNAGDTDALMPFRKMKEDVNDQRAGIVDLSIGSNGRRILSYTPLHVNDWQLIASTEHDFLYADIQAYMRTTYVAIIGTVLVFLTISAFLTLGYQKRKQQMEELIMKDALTGALTRVAFNKKCELMLREEHPGTYAILFLNLKNFKHINRIWGTAAGDGVLKYICKVLQNHLMEDEVFCRSEMDHFLLCIKADTEEKVQLRVDRLIEAVNSFHHDADARQAQYTLRFLSGAYIVENPQEDIALMENYARIASLSDSKGQACIFFNAELRTKMEAAARVEALFEESIERRDFLLYLQPKVSLDKMELCGAEALVRWIHPEHGMIYPSEFIPVLEAEGEIGTLDLYVFEETCKLLRKWMDEKKTIIPVSVNLSRVHMSRADFIDEYAAIKEKYNIPDNVIELEVTESTMLDSDQIQMVKNMIANIHQNGFLCSLDDFGFGYSSLAILKELNVDVVKLDKSFFNNHLDIKAKQVITNIIDLVHKLDMQVVAEGIETYELVDFLHDAQCDAVQGYVFSKPLSPADFEKWRETPVRSDRTGDA